MSILRVRLIDHEGNPVAGAKVAYRPDDGNLHGDMPCAYADSLGVAELETFAARHVDVWINGIMAGTFDGQGEIELICTKTGTLEAGKLPPYAELRELAKRHPPAVEWFDEDTKPF